jgi:branched-chain amino acid transport system ATP-binding protein
MGPILEVAGVSKRYGAKAVVDNVSFTLERGECLAVIGPNGAGKTTLFNLLDRSTQPDSGTIALDGNDITRTAQYQRARLGVGRAFQIPRPFIGLSAYENVLTGLMHGSRLGGDRARHRAIEILEAVGLAGKRDQIAGSLALLDRKRLELAKAMSVGFRVLLLDEIAGGLTEHEMHALVEVVRTLKHEHGVIWIEHIPHALIAVADRMMVLHNGAKLIEGKPAQVMNDPIVHEVYLGISVDDAASA